MSKVIEFGRDRNGAIAILFGVSAAALFVMVGVAIDSARAYSVNDKVRAALDASALAGAKLLDDQSASDDDVKQRAKSFFASHADRFRDYGVDQKSFRTESDCPAGTVVASVDVHYKSAFGGVVSMPTINFTPSATVTYKMKKIELALGLDITGSMDNDGKISALRTAARQMVEELNANNPAVGAVRVSVVPYAASVNIGASNVPAATGAPVGADTCVVNRKSMPGAVVDDPPGPGRWIETSSASDNSAYSCPDHQLLRLQDLGKTAEREAVLERINDLTADGMTAGHIGLSWGCTPFLRAGPPSGRPRAGRSPMAPTYSRPSC